MCENPVILNLHLRETGLLYRRLDVRPLVVEDRRSVADTHLALARRQEMGNGILGLPKIRKRVMFHGSLLFLSGHEFGILQSIHRTAYVKGE